MIRADLSTCERTIESGNSDCHSRAEPALDPIGGGNPGLLACLLDPCLRRGDKRAHQHFRLAIQRSIIGLLLLLVLGATRPLSASAGLEGAREELHLYVLAGQSNMAGRGALAEQDKEIHPRVFALNRENQWVPARRAYGQARQSGRYRFPIIGNEQLCPRRRS